MRRDVDLMIIGLLLSFSVQASTIGEFEKAWGPGTLTKNTMEGGGLQHVTDGKGDPDLLTAPLELNDFRGKNIYFDINIDKMKNLSGIELRLGDKEFKNYYALTFPYFSDPDFNIIQDQTWQTYSFSLSNASVVGHPERKLTSIGVYIQDNGSGPLKVALSKFRFQAAPAVGYASLTFDDGYIDHYYAAQLMHKYGMRGTAYVMPRQVGTFGYMNLKQLAELKDKYHWGISSHHVTPYTDFEPKELVKEISYTLKFLDDNGFSQSAHHLAYPMGRQDRKNVLPAVRRYFETARVAGGGVETLPPADPHLLRTINVLDTTKPEELAGVVKQAVTNGQWVILMFHHLVDQSKSPLEYKKKNFEKLVDLLAKANVRVVPVHEVYPKFKASRVAKY